MRLLSRSGIPRFSLFLLLVGSLAAAVLLISAKYSAVESVAALLLLCVLTALAESLAVAVPGGGSVSVAYPVSIAALLLFGPAPGALAAAMSAISIEDIRSKKAPHLMLFNLCQLTLSAASAGWLYAIAGGQLLEGRPLGAKDFPAVLLPLAVLAFTSFAVNTLLVAGAMAVQSGRSVTGVWVRGFLWAIPSQAALSVMGLALAQVIALVGPLGVLLFAVPLIVSRQLFESYTHLRHSYADTVRSLVGLIESKDAYTRGHSERVSEYALDIAEGMGFSERQKERLEIAALLHDLGKLGVPGAILQKPGSLTLQEYQQIQEHPTIGAEIIRPVDFLADVVPVVLYHHERFDGKGYCTGLSGNLIPLEARMLAVADSFDAMTSKRSYRDAMSTSDAVDEIARCSGTQFDPGVVQAFLSANCATRKDYAKESA